MRERDVDLDAVAAVADQCEEAIARLYDGPEAWLHLPWASLDELVGGIGEGNVWFVGGFSGHGKTSFLVDLTRHLLGMERTVYYCGTETVPNELHTRLACQRVGVYSGHVFTGKACQWANWSQEIRPALVKDIQAQKALGAGNRFLVFPAQRINGARIRAAFQDAAKHGADLVIIDHIDHIDHGGASSGFEDSRMLAHLVLDEAQRTRLRVIVATQFNNESLRGDRLGPYQPPQPHYVYMGGHKRQVAWGMLGLFRPLRESVTADELKGARAGRVKVKELLEPNALAVSVMKHRHYGLHEGDVVVLRFDHGRLSDIPERDRHSTTYEGVRRI